MEDIGKTILNFPFVRPAAKFHREHNCCCYFGTTKFGFHVITIGLLLGLVEEYFAPNPLRGVIKLALIAPFIATYIKDNSTHRMLCLYLFMLAMPIIAIVNLVSY